MHSSLGQGSNVVYGLVEDAKLVAGSKVATNLDLLDNMSKKGIGVVGTMRQNRLCNVSLPSKQQVKKMKRGLKEEVYVGDDQVLVVWKDSSPVYMISNFVYIRLSFGKMNQVVIIK
uniref:PiggyBac transposable element-derived protein domain-containing protein n=1 Tax=Scylla olivacea TaxID=85551 RepID=A0A0P4VTE0_SCYOL